MRKFVSDAPEASSTIALRGYIRSQPMLYTVNNNGDNDHSTAGYHHQQSHSVSGTTASSNLFVPFKRRFPYWAATTILYTHHRYPPSASQLDNLSLVLSASGSSKPSIRQPSFFFHLVWATSVELLRVRGAVLWTVGNAGNACGSSEDESLS